MYKLVIAYGYPNVRTQSAVVRQKWERKVENAYFGPPGISTLYMIGDRGEINRLLNSTVPDGSALRQLLRHHTNVLLGRG